MTLTLDRVIRHTIVHHSSTSTCIPNFIGIGKTFCGRTDGHLTHVIRSTLRSRPKNGTAKIGTHKFNTLTSHHINSVFTENTDLGLQAVHLTVVLALVLPNHEDAVREFLQSYEGD